MLLQLCCQLEASCTRRVLACTKDDQLKKLSKKQLDRLKRLCIARHKHDVRRLALSRGAARVTVPRQTGFFPAPRGARKLNPPEHFDFNVDEAGVLRWLKDQFDVSTSAIRKAHKTKKKRRGPMRVKSFHDFTKIKTMTPAAALVIAAFFDRHRQRGGFPIHVYDYEKWDPAVRAILAQVGFFDLLEVPFALDQGPQPAQTAKIERFASERKLQPEELGHLVDKLLGYILEAHPDCLSSDQAIVRTAKLFGALVEATENTRRHAYPEDTHTDYAVLPNWWLTGFADASERHLTLIVYDQGISMPGSLAATRPSSWPGHDMVNRIIERFSKGKFHPDDIVTDHAKIRLAMKMGISSTGDSHRGKGLTVVREAIKHCERARLHILSRNGGYLEETGKRAKSWPLSSPMVGTLIVWDLWL